MIDEYQTDSATGENFTLLLGDSCERMAEIPDNSMDLSVCSPPFDSLYTYSPSVRDLGNSSSRGEFIEHYRFIVEQQLRVTKPGRNACVHVAQVATKKAVDGFIGLTDFRGDVIRLFQECGWIFYGEVTIWKDPQAQSIRTKSHALAFQTKNRDSTKSRPAMADYLLIFKKPGDNAVPVSNAAVRSDVSNDDWIEWASPIWFDRSTTVDDLGGDGICPVWTDIKETNTLNVRPGRENADERHICPLQLDFIERCVRLYSNRGETVFTPFAGIGSEVFVPVKLGRRGFGIELKRSYWQAAVNNLRGLEAEMATPDLFAELG